MRCTCRAGDAMRGGCGSFRSPAHADFNERLHGDGVYGQRDHNAYQSARFVGQNLPRTHSIEQSWQFVAASVEFYCPEKHVTLARVRDNRGLTS